MDTVFNVQQRNSYNLSFQLVDEDGDDLALTSIDTLKMTLYYTNPRLTTGDRNHLATINSRYGQDIKNANNVVVSSAGLVTWSVMPADSAKLDSATEEEIHVALVTWTYSSGKQGSIEFTMNVKRVQYAES